MKQNSFGKTDIGLKRTHNEDNYTIVEELGLYLVADGMGGHNAGEVASRNPTLANALNQLEASRRRRLERIVDQLREQLLEPAPNEDLDRSFDHAPSGD